MRTARLTTLCLLLLSACDPSKDIADGGTICPPQPDLLQPTAKCAAAKGLSGDILGELCLDMDKIDTQGLTSRGFDLMAPKTKCAGWAVTGNTLQPTGIDTTARSTRT